MFSVDHLFWSIAMDFVAGENIEAVDQFGVWANAKIVEKRDKSLVVTFPPWKSEWDREILDASEVRSATEEEVLFPRRVASKKVRDTFNFQTVNDLVFYFAWSLKLSQNDVFCCVVKECEGKW